MPRDPPDPLVEAQDRAVPRSEREMRGDAALRVEEPGVLLRHAPPRRIEPEEEHPTAERRWIEDLVLEPVLVRAAQRS